MANAYSLRILRTELHYARDLLPHPLQYKAHPATQLAPLRGVLESIGICGNWTAYYSPRAHGALVMINGHGRATLRDDQLWPVDILDVTDQEADILLLSMDPLTALAQIQEEQARQAYAQTKSTDAAVDAFLQEQAARYTVKVPEALPLLPYIHDGLHRIEITCDARIYAAIAATLDTWGTWEGCEVHVT